MRLGEGVEWGIHCCTVLALLPPGAGLPARRLAEYHDVAPAYLAKHLQALAAAGLVSAERGRRGGYRLARPASDITLLDVVLALEGAAPAFSCTEIRRRGPAQVEDRLYSPVCGIAAAMWRAESAYRRELSQVSIADVLAGLARDVPSEAAVKAAAWMQEVLR